VPFTNLIQLALMENIRMRRVIPLTQVALPDQHSCHRGRFKFGVSEPCRMFGRSTHQFWTGTA